MDDDVIFFASRDQGTSLLILVQYVDFKRIEEMKEAEVKITLNDKLKDTTEVSCTFLKQALIKETSMSMVS